MSIELDDLNNRDKTKQPEKRVSKTTYNDPRYETIYRYCGNKRSKYLNGLIFHEKCVKNRQGTQQISLSMLLHQTVVCK